MTSHLNWSLALQHRRGLQCKASTVLHHRSIVLFPKTNKKQKGYAKSRESMNVQPIPKIWLLFSFFTSFLFWCSVCLDPLAMKMISHREGGCLADIRGDSSFMLLTRYIYCWICAYTPAMLLHPHSWAWICALPAHSQCVHMMAWLHTLVPMQQHGTVPAHRGGKPISQGYRWALEIDFDLHPAQCCPCQFPSGTGLFSMVTLKIIISRLNQSESELLPISTRKIFACFTLRRICGGEWVGNWMLSDKFLRCDDCSCCHALPYRQAHVQWVLLHRGVGRAWSQKLNAELPFVLETKVKTWDLMTRAPGHQSKHYGFIPPKICINQHLINSK